MYLFRIWGVVQGVGFRPFVYSRCSELGLRGYVKNTGSGVEVVVDDKERFMSILKDLPPLARIDGFEVKETPGEYAGFTIEKSGGRGFAEVPYDNYLCERCLAELRDRANRRCGYFFITCTDCGPRFSMLEKTPYDRRNTSMASFAMCPGCASEYSGPLDRRYHAEAIACPDCGPKVGLYSNGLPSGGIKEAAGLLKAGEVVAIKGVGGFHLSCRPESAKKLREFTGRAKKPYALMVRGVEEAEDIALLDDAEKSLLLSGKRPIVVARKKNKDELLDVSELDSIGLMLPYTALHYLLFEHLGAPLVMTSSNLPGRPITSRDNEQFVPHVLAHDRKIVNPIDDSVVKVISGRALFLRRSRGYVPKSIELKDAEDCICLGAEENAAVCIVKNGRAMLSQHLGDTGVVEAYLSYKERSARLLKMFDCSPEFIACDLNQSFNTSSYGLGLSERLGIPLVRVQHHLAHVFSVAGEKGLNDFIGIACDGYGLGSDGSAWGGEIFDGKERVGGLEPQPLLGGDFAARHPRRMLFGLLSRFLEGDVLAKASGTGLEESRILSGMLEQGFNCIGTSSCGRVLDAASAFLGFCDDRAYQGRAAMLLEANSTEPCRLEPVVDKNTLKTTPLFEYLYEKRNLDKGRLAATVQRYLAEGLFLIAGKIASGRPVVFSGGCAYNRIMSGSMIENGVHVNELVPAGDGGISFGQAVLASADPGD